MMSDHGAVEFIKELSKVPNKELVSKREETIPGLRASKFANANNVRKLERQLEGITKNKPKKSESKENKSSSDRASPSTDGKGNDAGKNLEFANQLVRCLEFGHIGNTLYGLSDLIYNPMLERDFDLLLRQAALLNKLPDDLKKSISTYKSSELYAWLLVHPSVPELPEMPDKRYLAVQNGILDLKKKKLLRMEDLSYEKRPVLFNRINAEYKEDYDDAEWKSSETFRFLKRLSDPDCEEQCIKAVLYIVGKICSNDRSGQNFYYVYGASNNGKSVLASYIQEILGRGNFGNLSLKDLTLQFAMINLRHALVNISTDEDTAVWKSSTASIIKRITGHDTLMVDVKYERMQQFRPYCVLLCMGNEEPKYSRELDAGGAISKRLFLIPTGPTVDDPDDDLLDRLKEEKDLFFSVAIDFFMQHKHPDKIVDVEEIISPDILPKDVFNYWIRDCVKITDDSSELFTEDLWLNYCGYVQTVPSASRMKRRAFEMECSVKLSSNKSKSRSQNKSCYVGLRLGKKSYSPDSEHNEMIEPTEPDGQDGKLKKFGYW